MEDRVVTDVLPPVSDAGEVERRGHDIGMRMFQGAMRDDRHGGGILHAVDGFEERVVPEPDVVAAEHSLARLERDDLRDSSVGVAGMDAARLEAGDHGVDGAPGRAFSVPHERDVRDQVEAEERGREQTRDGGASGRGHAPERHRAENGQGSLERHGVAEDGGGAEPGQQVGRCGRPEHHHDEVQGVAPRSFPPPDPADPLDRPAPRDEDARHVHAQHRDPAQDPRPGR